ncbi:response regulator [Magnetofaba australis]|uniref:Putative response regulator receiver protein n=1 Tax=Magnetofaba australis IT-1 TaxID=1434232 RepID=A0A1Y2K649_9PROT|nr:response regulator [Magnetofaba australis]OSM04443.1 putative response regulator receiver protein [Magnetofaba australis IT-1]
MADTPIVLVVDDDPLNRELLDDLLEEEHYEVLLAEDGEDGWKVMQERRGAIDVVLLDRMMPRLDGLSLLKRVKEDPELKKIPVVFQTAKTSQEEIQEGLRAGAYYYITKPFDQNTLLAVVQTAIAERRDFRQLQTEAKRFSSIMKLMKSGAFEFRTLDEGLDLAAFLASLCPDPDQVAMGLSELLINAVEHGNLGITYEEKSALNLQGAWIQEVERRLDLPEHCEKSVSVTYAMDDEGDLHFFIEDEGHGFDWEKYLEFDPKRAFDTHGRGIAMSRAMSFKNLIYTEPGNKVLAIVDGKHANPDSDDDAQ